MSEDRLEEIKRFKYIVDTEGVAGMLSDDMRWLVSEVERLNRMLTSACIFKAQEDHNRMVAEKDATIATLRKALDRLIEATSKPLVEIMKRYPENVSHVVDRLEIHRENSKKLAEVISDAKKALATAQEEQPQTTHKGGKP